MLHSKIANIFYHKKIDKLYKAKIIIAKKIDLILFDEISLLNKSHHKSKDLISKLKRFFFEYTSI